MEDETVIRGALAFIRYDNLGANNCTGYVESFGTKNVCRFCTTSKKETEIMVEEDECKIRTIEEYNNTLSLIAESEKVDLEQTMGLKRECVLNQLKHFHIMRNKSVNIMHDLNEGAISESLQLLFSFCISNRLFTED